MGGGKEPGGFRSRLVEVEPAVDRVRHRGERFPQVEIERGRVHRVPGGDDEGVHLLCADVLGERAQALVTRFGVDEDALLLGGGVAAERGIDGMCERVHDGRLPVPGDDHRTRPRSGEVLRQRIDELLLLRVELRALRGSGKSRQRSAAVRQSRGQRDRDARHLRRLHAQPVVGAHPRYRERALHRIEPVHLLRRIALVREGAHVPEIPGLRGERVAAQGGDDGGPGEVVDGVERLSEGETRSLLRLLVRQGGEGLELRRREILRDPVAQIGEQRRRRRMQEEPQSGATVLRAKRQRLVVLRGEEVAIGARHAPVQDHAGALRIVELQDGSLIEDAGASQAGGVLRVPLHLGGMTFAGGDEQTGREAVVHRGRGVVQRPSGQHLFGLPRVGQDLLVRLLQASGERGEGGRGGEELHHLAAGGRPRVAGRELALRRERTVPLLDAAPLRARVTGCSGLRPPPVAGGARSSVRDGERLQRWHVVQFVRVCTSYSCLRRAPRANCSLSPPAFQVIETTSSRGRRNLSGSRWQSRHQPMVSGAHFSTAAI